MSRFNFCDCPAGFSAAPERHAPDCPGRSGAGKAPTPVPTTYKTPATPAPAVTPRKGMEFWDKICALKHYGFLHSPDGSRVVKTEGIGNWIDKHEAQEIVDQAQSEINQLRAEGDALQLRLNAADQQIDELSAPPIVVPELTAELRYIFGMMCFQCITYAQALRGMGHTIANKAEDEQAATIHWMLGHYLRDPDNWRTNAIAEIKAAKLAAE